MAQVEKPRHEISDLVVNYDPDTMERLPVRKSQALEQLRSEGSWWASRVLERFPAKDDILDDAAVDGVLLRSHLELQRLHEEFLTGERMLEVLGPLVRALRAHRPDRPVRVVDIGCGLGFILRWLAYKRALGPDVTLLGTDFNPMFTFVANLFATQERLPVRFVTANAFTLEEPATVYISSGVLHHFRGPALARMFAQQDQAEAYVHFDIYPTPIAPIGSFIFHIARMREPLAQHDGYLSAVRAHQPQVLLDAARAGLPQLQHGLYDAEGGVMRLVRIMHAVVGIRPELEQTLRQELGRDAHRLTHLEAV